MMVDVVLAVNSDRLFMAAVGVYVLAMALHTAQYAAVRAARPAPAAPVAALASTGISAGAGATTDRSVTAAAGRAERLGRMAVALVVLGALLHAGSLVTRGLATLRWPLGNMYEFTSAICLAAVVAWLVILRRAGRSRAGRSRAGRSRADRSRADRSRADRSRADADRKRAAELAAVGPFVLLPVVVLLFLAGTVLYAQAAPVQPALQSYWLVVHVTTISASSGMLLVAGVASLLYLVRHAGRAPRLPAADVLDRLAYRVTIVAFPIYTFAVIAGAIWAEAAWGRFWGWDPKETVAFVAWIVYAGYLHARATAGWRTGRAAWINVAGFLVIAFNLFFINMVVAGLHSYAGL